MRHCPILAAMLLLGGCGSEEGGQTVPEPSGPPVVQQARPPAPAAAPAAGGWEVRVSGAETALHLADAAGKAAMIIACAPGQRLTVHVPGFTSIGSEDRFALGLGDEPVTLVADPGWRGGGVRAEAPAPARLEELLERSARLSAVYGNQQSGPHPAPPAALKEQLAEACAGK